MEKTLAIVSRNQSEAEYQKEQINSLFGDNIDVRIYPEEGAGIDSGIYEDLILLSSYESFHKMRSRLVGDGEIVIAHRTITKAALEKLMALGEGTRALLVDESPGLAMETSALVYQLGAKHIELVPCSSHAQGGEQAQGFDTIVLMGERENPCPLARNVVDIGFGLLDISTILDIAFKLDLDYVIQRQNVINSFKEIVTVNVGLINIIGRFNRFEAQLDILLQVLDDGIVAVDAEGIVYSCNEGAEKIIGMDRSEMVGREWISLMPEIPFYKALKDKESISEKIISMHGYDVVAAVDPIIHSNKLYGAVARIKRFSDIERKQHKLRSQLISKGHRAKYGFYNIFGNSPQIMQCKDIARRMAKSSSSVLITGESGTGKELFAQAIHNSSERRDYQFVAVNCGAIPESLLESELFGYEEGAFTGARKGGKTGLFELAHKGTLFLDEIGEMPINLQARLLRVLQERQVMRIGGDRVIDVDVRIIAATNRNLIELVREGRFRQDLYFRLNVLPLRIPALRERREDITALIESFKREFESGFELSDAAREMLMGHTWEGNIRELRNYVEYFANLDKRVIEAQDMPFAQESQQRLTALSGIEKEMLRAFEEEARGKMGDYRFILSKLLEAQRQGDKLGRRSLSRLAASSGRHVSEQEIRGMFLELEKFGMVEISKGRAGTVITEFGIKILDEI
ncbi:signal-transduction and transcriptional-control protein Stc (plasmid) [Peptoclostridium acidaminophilum DSM 3953]|uniref:Signal-transduction and transcriptional-control protein Stc n=1 Tax=Peptoclostridium acidaminophilum DSM 3953 TaxID=1286171 RepID=W8T929_PEPAC|nr:sigma 54-interacting transcriptional regulator [Peptoclostridium acidaminophilum]AHM58169.1 signal-transduction and transcriptional-control protein Stc [Peptoclostridium acidaminophilum DSM 3953]